MTADSPQACATQFTDALVRRDIKAALARLTDEVVFFYSNGATIVGKDAFSALMTTSWKVVENDEYQSAESTWVAQTDDAAAVVYSFAWSGTARGTEIGANGRVAQAFSRQPDGSCRVTHEHLSNGQ